MFQGASMKAKCICREWAQLILHARSMLSPTPVFDSTRTLSRTSQAPTTVKPGLSASLPMDTALYFLASKWAMALPKHHSPPFSPLCAAGPWLSYIALSKIYSARISGSPHQNVFSITSLFLIKALMFTGIIHTKKCSLHTSISKLFLKTSILLIYGPKFRLFYTIIVVIIMTLFSLSSYFLDS